ncbi:MAG: hypothetical protein ACI8ZM_002041 [Crocinitomix sp.]|jgi:hypothetical protein
MKSILISLFALSILFSCSSSTPLESIEESEIITEGIFPFDTDLSFACNICLLKDSIDIINTKVVNAKAMAEPLDSTLLSVLDSLNIELEEWKTEFKTNHKEVFQIELPERWNSKDPENVALQACLLEYAFDKLDSIERFQYLSEYTSYHYYTKVAELYKNIDTSTFKEADGDYALKFKGETIRNSPAEFPIYWGNALFHYYEIRNYIEDQKDQRLVKITGKHTNQLTQIEYLMFDKHESKANGLSSDSFEFLENDTTFQRLFKNYERAWLNGK